MGPDLELVGLFAGLHLLGLALAAVLLIMFVRSDQSTTWPRRGDDDGGGGGGRGPNPPARPSGPRGGGLPLPDAQAARMRLREPARLGDLVAPPRRRPSHPARRRPVAPRAD